MVYQRAFLLSLLAILAAYIPISAQTTEKDLSFWNRDQLTGDWGGLRSSLDESGIDIEAHLLADLMANRSGGVKQGSVFVELITLKMLLDAERVFGIEGMNILASGLQSNGGSISALSGDIQGVNNIEAQKTVRIYELWLQQNFLNERVSVLGGLYDINSEFDFMESASLFIQSSQGLGGELAGSGLIGPPTFPIGGLGGRVKFLPSRRFYFQVGVFDGVSGSLDNTKHADFNWTESDGSFYIGEFGILLFGSALSTTGEELTTLQDRRHIGREVASDYKFKFAFGGWSYSKNYAEKRYEIHREIRKGHLDNEKGFYLLADLKLSPNSNKPYQQLSLFGRIGFASNSVSRFSAYRGGGITFKGLIPGDPDGLTGISIASVLNSDLYSELFPESTNFETVLEWTYLTKVIPWLNLQPNVQYVINPGTVSGTENALVIGLRSDITF